MRFSRKKVMILAAALLLLAGSLLGGAWYWANTPVAMDAERVDYLVEAGSSPRRIAGVLEEAGIHVHADAWVALARLMGQDRHLKAGAYEAVQGDTPLALLDRMTAGDMRQARVALIEGWTYQRIRQALLAAPELQQTLDDVSEAELLDRLGVEDDSLEGWLYPDTYVFVPGSTDFDILRRAHVAQTEVLEQAWASRQEGLPLQTPYEALILASIVEKETGHAEDRSKVAGVFINRLRMGMPLQTDPTVIYGMGDGYTGRIRKKDLQTDTPWNTYTRPGLPPTPIASAGRAALDAVLQPDSYDYLYFVSRGDGTSEFSKTLAAHNRAVAKYILGRN